MPTPPPAPPNQDAFGMEHTARGIITGIRPPAIITANVTMENPRAVVRATAEEGMLGDAERIRQAPHARAGQIAPGIRQGPLERPRTATTALEEGARLPHQITG